MIIKGMGTGFPVPFPFIVHNAQKLEVNPYKYALYGPDPLR